MVNRIPLIVLLGVISMFSLPVSLEAQTVPLNVCCNPVPGTNMVHISFIDPGVYLSFDVSVNGVIVMVLPAAAPLATITALVAVGGNGTHTICVQGVQGPQGSGQTSCCQITLPIPRQFKRGDSNDDQTVNLADAIASLQMLFGSLPMTCHDAVDANDDGATDLSDPIYVLTYLFGGGVAPPAPFPQCGVDSTPDTLICHITSPCP